MREFLVKSLNGLRRGVVTFCAVAAMLVVYGVSTIVTQGMALVGVTTAALVAGTNKASAHRRRYRHTHRRRRGRRRYRGRRWRRRGWRRRGYRRRRWRGRRRRRGVYIRF